MSETLESYLGKSMKVCAICGEKMRWYQRNVITMNRLLVKAVGRVHVSCHNRWKRKHGR